jgi:hypothetical protein
MKTRLPHLPAQLPRGDLLTKDLAFLAAWEDGTSPRSIDAATILCVRQIKRAEASNRPAPQA